jgi:hypothetical protein
MGKKTETETVRLRQCSARVLRKLAYNPPFNCSSVAEFFRLLERKDSAALHAWWDAVERESK